MQSYSVFPKFNFAEYQKSAWLYRLAAASGHWKASKHLAEMLIHSGENYDFYAQYQNGDTLEETIGTNQTKIAEDLVQRGIPYGYFLKGTLLDASYNKRFAAQRYIRKAADIGKPSSILQMICSLPTPQEMFNSTHI